VEVSRKALVLSAVVVVLLLVFPLSVGTEHTINLVISLFVVVILAQAWNVLAGYAGQISLGNAAFFGMGALAFHSLAWRWGLNLLLSLPVAALSAVLLASLIGIPALRLKGAYFAIGTLALAEVLRITVGNVFPRTVYIPTEQIGSYGLLSRYYLALGLVILTQAVAFFMVASKTGLAMRALREDEEAADSSGVNPFKYKYLALVYSSFFSGLAGGLFAYYQISILPTSLFGPQWTFEPLVAASVGGAGTLVGPVIGSVFLILLMELFALTLGKTYLIIFGAMFVCVVLFFPAGLVDFPRWVRRVTGKKLREGPMEEVRSDQGSPQQKALLETLLQMTLDHKMHERFYTARDFQWAADLRRQANRLATVAERLESITQEALDSAGGTKSVLEAEAPLSIEQMAMINHRDVVPYMAILWYGHGGEPPEFMEIRGELTGRMWAMRATSTMLLEYMNKHFEGNEAALIIPDSRFLEGSVWRMRVSTGLYKVATYYRLTAESMAMALKSLDAAPLEGKALLDADKRGAAVEMMKAAQRHLNEAATHLGVAATELGKDEERWQHSQSVLRGILGERR